MTEAAETESPETEAAGPDAPQPDAEATEVAAPAEAPVDVQVDEQQLRMVEALLFGAAEPLDLESLSARLPDGADIGGIITELRERYATRGVNLVHVAGKWAFRTAPDLAFLLERERTVTKKLSKAAVETLAIIAYHQPVTRAEIEEVRGVSLSRGTLDVLMEQNFVKIRGRKRVPGRPVTYGTTDFFLTHFGLEAVGDLPGMDELKAAGLLRSVVPPSVMFKEQAVDKDDSDEDPENDGGEDPLEEGEALVAGPAVAAPDAPEVEDEGGETEREASAEAFAPEDPFAGAEADDDDDVTPVHRAPAQQIDAVPVSARGAEKD